MKTTAGGIEWEIGTTEKTVNILIDGNSYSPFAVSAVSSAGNFKIVDYHKWDWRDDQRPFNRDAFLALDADNKPLIARGTLGEVLNWLANYKAKETASGAPPEFSLWQ